MRFILNHDAEKFVPRGVKRGHRHGRERYGCSPRSEEVGCCVGRHTCRQVQADCWGWMGRLHPTDRIQGTYRAKNQRATAVVNETTREKKAKEEGAGVTTCGEKTST